MESVSESEGTATAAAEQIAQTAETAAAAALHALHSLAVAGHLAHQLLHEIKLLEQLIDLDHARARARRDALFAAGAEHRGILALVGCHREDDRLGVCHHLGVKLGVCHLLAELAGHHARELFKAAHALELDELVVIVGESEAVLFELFFELFRLFLVDALLGALDERQHVAHAEDALRHAVGVEGLDHVELFARAHKLDGFAGRRADREGCAAAGVAVWHGCTIQFVSNPNVFSEATYLNLGWLSIPVTIIWIVAITNAVNFIDGLDGLAVGVSAISTASLIVVALMVKEVNIAVILCALFGACLGFIPYNMNPAKIFMGDTGSTFLGYILATLSITGLFKMYAIISFAVPFLILGIPIFDISFAFLRRIAHGQNPMKADRGHVHHRLIDMGFSQKQAVAISYMLTGILGLAAVLLTSSGELKALILIAAIFIVSAIGFKLIFAKNDPAEDEPEEKQEEPHE